MTPLTSTSTDLSKTAIQTLIRIHRQVSAYGNKFSQLKTNDDSQWQSILKQMMTSTATGISQLQESFPKQEKNYAAKLSLLRDTFQTKYEKIANGTDQDFNDQIEKFKTLENEHEELFIAARKKLFRLKKNIADHKERSQSESKGNLPYPFEKIFTEDFIAGCVNEQNELQSKRIACFNELKDAWLKTHLAKYALKDAIDALPFLDTKKLNDINLRKIGYQLQTLVNSFKMLSSISATTFAEGFEELAETPRCLINFFEKYEEVKKRINQIEVEASLKLLNEYRGSMRMSMPLLLGILDDKLAVLEEISSDPSNLEIGEDDLRHSFLCQRESSKSTLNTFKIEFIENWNKFCLHLDKLNTQCALFINVVNIIAKMGKFYLDAEKLREEMRIKRNPKNPLEPKSLRETHQTCYLEKSICFKGLNESILTNYSNDFYTSPKNLAESALSQSEMISDACSLKTAFENVISFKIDLEGKKEDNLGDFSVLEVGSEKDEVVNLDELPQELGIIWGDQKINEILLKKLNKHRNAAGEHWTILKKDISEAFEMTLPNIFRLLEQEFFLLKQALEDPFEYDDFKQAFSAKNSYGNALQQGFTSVKKKFVKPVEREEYEVIRSPFEQKKR